MTQVADCAVCGVQGHVQAVGSSGSTCAESTSLLCDVSASWHHPSVCCASYAEHPAAGWCCLVLILNSATCCARSVPSCSKPGCEPCVSATGTWAENALAKRAAFTHASSVPLVNVEACHVPVLLSASTNQ
jgi:hypothetical protein